MPQTVETARQAVVRLNREGREWRKAMKPAFDALNAEMRAIEKQAKATRSKFFDSTYIAKRDVLLSVARRIEKPPTPASKVSG